MRDLGLVQGPPDPPDDGTSPNRREPGHADGPGGDQASALGALRGALPAQVGLHEPVEVAVEHAQRRCRSRRSVRRSFTSWYGCSTYERIWLPQPTWAWRPPAICCSSASRSSSARAARIACSLSIAFARFWSWLRSSWHVTTMPGRQVGEADRRRRLVDVLAAGARGPEHVDADVLVVELDVARVVDHGPHLDGGEARLAAGVAVERADAHQPVRAPLALHQPVGVAAADRELGRQDAGLGALARRRRPRRRSPAARPSGVYIRSSISAQSWASTPPSLALIGAMASASSCSPVNRLRSSSSSSRPLSRRDGGLDLGLLALVALLAGQLVQHLGVLDLLGQRVVDGEVVARAGVRAR